MEVKSLILMAVYNGSNYLAEQIESILSQSYTNWKLIIRDDGSSDNSIEILENYASHDPRIEIIKNTSDRHGAYINFWTLIHYAKNLASYDYYFFSDQDDIWCNDKLEKMIAFDQSFHDAKKPRLIYSDMQIIDGRDNIIIESLNHEMKIGTISGLSPFFAHVNFWGCDLLINRSLFENIPIIDLDDEYINILSHDNYFAKYTFLFGEIRFFPVICIKHRRHGKNETGDYHMKLSVSFSIRYGIKRWKKICISHARTYTQTLIFANYLKKNGINIPIVQEICEAIMIGGMKGCIYLLKNKVKSSQYERTIALYLVMFTNNYKKYLYDMDVFLGK